MGSDIRSWLRGACMLSLMLLSGFARAEPHGLTLEDMLRAEGLGNVVIEPTGRWLVFERIRPYDQYQDYSFRTYAFARSGHQLWRYDLKSNAPAEPVPGISPEPHTYLQEFSPDGRYLLIVQYDSGKLNLAAYDMFAERLVRFGPAPSMSRNGSQSPVWINDSEFVYAALPAGSAPIDTSVRVLVGERLSAAWKDAWRGDVVTASEIRTFPESPEGDARPGALLAANAATGELRPIASGEYTDLRLSPDGRWMAGLEITAPFPAGAAPTLSASLPAHRLVIFNFKSSERISPALPLNIYPYSLEWAPDGERLLFFAWGEAESPEEGRFHIYNISSGELAAIDHSGLDLVSERERGWVARPERAAFLGGGIAVYARPPGEEGGQRVRLDPPRADWYHVLPGGGIRNLTADLAGVSPRLLHADASGILILAASGVYRLTAYAQPESLTPEISGQIWHIPAGTFMAAAGIRRPDFGADLLFATEAEGRRQFISVRPQNPSADQVLIEDMQAVRPDVVAGSVSAGVFAYLQTRGGERTLYLDGPGVDGAPLTLAHINQHLADQATQVWKSVQYEVPGPDGSLMTLQSCLLMPASSETGRPVPVIVDVYPGRASPCEHLTFPTYADPSSAYLWSGRGYAYLRLALPQDLLRRDEGPIAGIADLTHPALDALIAAGIADPDRIALHGYSQGAAAALHLAALSTRVSAVIARHGFADYFSHYFGGAGIYSVIDGAYLGAEAIRYEAGHESEFGLGADPFEAPERYILNSPVFLAKDIQAPVMLIHSDLDAFSIGQFDEMFGALRRTGGDARYVRYWGEGHGLSSPANIRDMWSRMLSFLEDHGIGPEPERAAERGEDQLRSQPSIP